MSIAACVKRESKPCKGGMFIFSELWIFTDLRWYLCCGFLAPAGRHVYHVYNVSLKKVYGL